MDKKFIFQPISFSWVAINPKAKGIVQFIGGAFFGTFPTFFYYYFLNQVFEAGYTIVALPFRFTFDHWSVAISLIKEQYVIRREILTEVKRLGGDVDVYLCDSNYFWVGHSLGCKYIALLELLSDEYCQVRQEIDTCVSDKSQSSKTIKKIEFSFLDLKEEISKTEIKTEDFVGRNAEITNLFIKSQPSLLIAPDISDTESAIPIRWLAKALDDLGWGAIPTRRQTQCFIKYSKLFNLTAIISFDLDTIAGSKKDIYKNQKCQENSDVLFFIKQLQQKCVKTPTVCPVLNEELENSKHLEPIGIKVGNYIVDLNPFDKFIKPIRVRHLENVVIHFLEELERRQQLLD